MMDYQVFTEEQTHVTITLYAHRDYTGRCLWPGSSPRMIGSTFAMISWSFIYIAGRMKRSSLDTTELRIVQVIAERAIPRSDPLLLLV